MPQPPALKRGSLPRSALEVLPEYYLVVCSENDDFLLLAVNVGHTLALQMSQQVTTCRCKPGQLTKRPLCGRNSVEGNWVGAWERGRHPAVAVCDPRGGRCVCLVLPK